jgi:hypothetical protein
MLNRPFLGVLVAFTLCATRDAHAYCRKMTCNPTPPEKVATTPKPIVCQTDKVGCVSEGKPLVWSPSQLPFTFRFHRRYSALLIREETKSAIREAFFRWSDVVCPDGKRTSLRFSEGEELDVDKPLEDIRIPVPGSTKGRRWRPPPFGIYFRDHGWPHDDPDGQIALTTTDFDPPTGTIGYADIEINTANQKFSTSELTGDASVSTYDLQSAITHEVGHFIGLAHSFVPDSIMVSHLCESTERCSRGTVTARRLANDDIDAVCTLYPSTLVQAGATDAAAPSTCACATTDVSSKPGSLVVLSIVGGVASLARLRRRQRQAKSSVCLP